MPAFDSCNSAYKTKNLGDFFLLFTPGIIKLEVNIYLVLENITEYNDLDYFQTKKNQT